MKAGNLVFIGLVLFAYACGTVSQATPEGAIPATGATVTSDVQISVTASPSAMESPAAPITAADVTHIIKPSDTPPEGSRTFDVDSSGTGPDKRAPYGDSYRLNLFERPFAQDMTYIPDLDIVSYAVSSDADWYYVSIALIGKNPNNSLGIDYSVEIDLDQDGSGDTLIRAQAPFTTDWDTRNVRIYADQNHDAGGLSSIRPDAAPGGDGYESLIFNGGPGDADPDLAWVRMNAGPGAQIQIAFKRSLGNSAFMLGVAADGGLKDAARMDYNDHFTAAEAGSPVRDNPDYPLKSLFAVDNVCRAGVGFQLTGNEPKGCPVKPGPRQSGGPTEVVGCPPPPGCIDWDPVACVCNG